VTAPTTTSAASQPGRAERPPEYTFAREPDGRSWTAREDLVEVLARELLGPMHGPDEVLESSPDAVYLVGRIAPFRLRPDDGPPGDEVEPDAPTDVGDELDAQASRGVPVTAVDESAAEADEDTVEDQPQQRGLMIPASMGLRFQVPADLDQVTVTASWGTYHVVRRDAEDDREDPGRRRYRRTPVQVEVTVRLGDVAPGRTFSEPLRDEVVLRVDRYDDAASGDGVARRVVEVALCNDR
jgi:hypothetical protein